MTIDYQVGQSLDLLKELPDQSVDLIATSPPFLALRNYNDLDGQIGSEANPGAFLDVLLTHALEYRRVLTPTGSIAIELGDTYSGSGGAGGDYNADGLREGQAKFVGSSRRDRAEQPRQNQGGVGWPLSKSLCGIPTLFAWSLAYGRNLLNPDMTFEPWRVRNLIVWERNNPPVGALGDKVRPAVSYITIATPSPKRWFDLDAVRGEPLHGYTSTRALPHEQPARNVEGQPQRKVNPIDDTGQRIECHPAGSPPLDHWHDQYDAADLAWLVNGTGSSLAHYAMWPPKLAERLILSMCPQSVCITCGEPRRRIVEIKPSPRTQRSNQQMGSPAGNGHHGHLTRKATTTGWSDCGHDNWRRGATLDPFAGTGTTMCVAELHGRDSIGFDLDPANPTLVDRRMKECKQALFGHKDTNIDGQLDMFTPTP